MLQGQFNVRLETLCCREEPLTTSGTSNSRLPPSVHYFRIHVVHKMVNDVIKMHFSKMFSVTLTFESMTFTASSMSCELPITDCVQSHWNISSHSRDVHVKSRLTSPTDAQTHADSPTVWCLRIISRRSRNRNY